MDTPKEAASQVVQQMNNCKQYDLEAFYDALAYLLRNRTLSADMKREVEGLKSACYGGDDLASPSTDGAQFLNSLDELIPDRATRQVKDLIDERLTQLI
jgi:hypothetical protein